MSSVDDDDAATIVRWSLPVMRGRPVTFPHPNTVTRGRGSSPPPAPRTGGGRIYGDGALALGTARTAAPAPRVPRVAAPAGTVPDARGTRSRAEPPPLPPPPRAVPRRRHRPSAPPAVAPSPAALGAASASAREPAPIAAVAPRRWLSRLALVVVLTLALLVAFALAFMVAGLSLS